MALNKPEVVDAIGIEKDSGFAVLTIADSWDWKDERTHLLALQEKLNAYFGFIESGEILKSYPDAADRQIVIDVVSRFPMPQIGVDLLRRTSDVCVRLEVLLRSRHHPDSTEELGNEQAS